MKIARLPVLLAIALFAGTCLRAQNVVVQWNDIASATIVTNGKEASVASGVWFAYVHLAVFDAVNAIDHRFEPYLFTTRAPVGASQDAAAVTAAHRVLVHYFPGQQTSLDAQFAVSLAGISDAATNIAAGMAVGEASAQAIIDARTNDGLLADVPYTPPIGPGFYQRTPPAFAAPLTPWLGHMMPFTMADPAQFLPDEGPTPLDGEEWIDNYNETKTLGAVNSTARTPEQTEIGLFWTEHTGQQYARAFRNLATQKGLSTSDSARLMAMLWAGYADAGIGCWNAKFFFSFWRPVTAIRAGGGNPALLADPNWTPLANTPAHPEFPAAHGCVTGSVARTLQGFFHTREVTLVVSSAVTNTTHTFTNTKELEEEVFGARIYSGFHYRHSLVKGFELGHSVVRRIQTNYFRRLDGGEQIDDQ